MKPLTIALSEYRDAVVHTEFCRDHGTYGDGKLSEAVKWESAARYRVLQAAREAGAK